VPRRGEHLRLVWRKVQVRHSCGQNQGRALSLHRLPKELSPPSSRTRPTRSRVFKRDWLDQGPPLGQAGAFRPRSDEKTKMRLGGRETLRYQPIEESGFVIGNHAERASWLEGRVGRFGCACRVSDSPSVFGAISRWSDKGGRFSIRPRQGRSAAPSSIIAGDYCFLVHPRLHFPGRDSGKKNLRTYMLSGRGCRRDAKPTRPARPRRGRTTFCPFPVGEVAGRSTIGPEPHHENPASADPWDPVFEFRWAGVQPGPGGLGAADARYGDAGGTARLVHARRRRERLRSSSREPSGPFWDGPKAGPVLRQRRGPKGTDSAGDGC